MPVSSSLVFPFELSVSSRLKYYIGGAIALLLLLMLFYPFGYDQAAFTVGGEMVARHGAIPYRDLLDTKPPGIFYLYAMSSMLFGHHVWSIRLLDVLITGGGLYYFYRIIKRYTSSEILALTAIAITGLHHVVIGYWMTAQAETFALIPSLVAFDYTLRLFEDSKPWKAGLIVGIASVILILLKFTLATVPLAIVLFIVATRPKGWLSFLANLVGCSVLLLGLYFLHLSIAGGFERFVEGLKWVSAYAALDPLFSPNTIGKIFFQLFPSRLLYTFSPTFFLVLSFGIAWWVKRTNELTNTSNRFFALSLFMLILFLLAVMYERKCFTYHYARSLWSAGPFEAIGILLLFQYAATWYKNSFRAKGLLRKVAAVLAIGLTLFFSSFFQLLSQPLAWTASTLLGKDIPKQVQQRFPEYFAGEQEEVGNILKPKLKENDKVFFWGNDVGVYFYLDKLPTTMCLTNTPFITTWTPQSWKDTLIAQLEANPPQYFISETGDAREYISGENEDSFQQLKKFSKLNDFVSANYILDTAVGHFIIYRSLSQSK